MTPDLLMQPFEQSFTALPTNGYYNNNSVMMGPDNYMLGYNMPVENLDFRPTFYNPFEIKHRRRTSRAQLKILEESFSDNPKPNATVRRILAQQLDMTPRGVQIWFQNRRAKAKLLRRKSSLQTETHLIHSPSASPKNMDARSIATAAAASCIFDSCSPECNKKELSKDRFPQCERSEEWSKYPLHPLAPVIEEQPQGFQSMSPEDWRRRSCPSLHNKNFTRYELMWSPEYYPHPSRRMTADQVYPIESSSDVSRNPFAYNDSQWSGSSPSSVDLFQTFNYSPISQQMTPKLSTGSPISIEGGYYDSSCYDLMLSSSSSPAPIRLKLNDFGDPDSESE
ncbi:homeobox domain-containing protein [Sporodiniella umbellata]|nr:homeobox domain-containing protein [Sporodiniella umbellata]